jgi:hypothetical protein
MWPLLRLLLNKPRQRSAEKATPGEGRSGSTRGLTKNSMSSQLLSDRRGSDIKIMDETTARLPYRAVVAAQEMRKVEETDIEFRQASQAHRTQYPATEEARHPSPFPENRIRVQHDIRWSSNTIPEHDRCPRSSLVYDNIRGNDASITTVMNAVPLWTEEPAHLSRANAWT